MQMLRRSIVLQIVFYTGFFFYGVDYILRSLITRDTLFTVLELVFLGVVIVGGIIWYFITKKDDLVVVNQRDTQHIKIVLYVIAGALILGIFSSLLPNLESYLIVISGSVMSLAAIYGLYISIKVFITND
ncbi:MAG: hypothetical protein PHF62_02290 [Acholeplasmataceae bacterium]|jgi:hypothetical protein|nr:hypothetical protein [Acholeplasmataceae bacterium]MDD4203935.1 hypothetical protein [Acholeplasmataceae bacterium]MDD4468563.1 hypothetical protein [Acholeplasmataceae bacterium]MDD4824448.1 hypothetical protein [Acholeplasmataceae bacterium]MDY0316583.1 hypothetical protein [Acholeplasmatales bacterium]